jgi:hypothetical protein
MFSSHRFFRARQVASIVALLLLVSSNASAGVITINNTSPDPVSPGASVLLDIDLTAVALPNPTDSIISIFLDFTATDPALTSSGLDFSGFDFTRNPGLDGLLSLQLDSDVSVDGLVSLDADLFPFGSDSGIADGTAAINLGTLSVVAPASPGTYSVDLRVDSSFPVFGTSFILDDNPFLPTAVAPTVEGANFTVASTLAVPEPSGLLLFGFAPGYGLLCHRRRRTRASKEEDRLRESRPA